MPYLTEPIIKDIEGEIAKCKSGQIAWGEFAESIREIKRMEGYKQTKDESAGFNAELAVILEEKGLLARGAYIRSEDGEKELEKILTVASSYLMSPVQGWVPPPELREKHEIIYNTISDEVQKFSRGEIDWENLKTTILYARWGTITLAGSNVDLEVDYTSKQANAYFNEMIKNIFKRAEIVPREADIGGYETNLNDTFEAISAHFQPGRFHAPPTPSSALPTPSSAPPTPSVASPTPSSAPPTPSVASPARRWASPPPRVEETEFFKIEGNRGTVKLDAIQEKLKEIIRSETNPSTGILSERLYRRLDEFGRQLITYENMQKEKNPQLKFYADSSREEEITPATFNQKVAEALGADGIAKFNPRFSKEYVDDEGHNKLHRGASFLFTLVRSSNEKTVDDAARAHGGTYGEPNRPDNLIGSVNFQIEIILSKRPDKATLKAELMKLADKYNQDLLIDYEHFGDLACAKFKDLGLAPLSRRAGTEIKRREDLELYFDSMIDSIETKLKDYGVLRDRSPGSPSPAPPSLPPPSPSSPSSSPSLPDDSSRSPSPPPTVESPLASWLTPVTPGALMTVCTLLHLQSPTEPPIPPIPPLPPTRPEDMARFFNAPDSEGRVTIKAEEFQTELTRIVSHYTYEVGTPRGKQNRIDGSQAYWQLLSFGNAFQEYQNRAKMQNPRIQFCSETKKTKATPLSPDYFIQKVETVLGQCRIPNFDSHSWRKDKLHSREGDLHALIRTSCDPQSEPKRLKEIVLDRIGGLMRSYPRALGEHNPAELELLKKNLEDLRVALDSAALVDHAEFGSMLCSHLRGSLPKGMTKELSRVNPEDLVTHIIDGVIAHFKSIAEKKRVDDLTRMPLDPYTWFG